MTAFVLGADAPEGSLGAHGSGTMTRVDAQSEDETSRVARHEVMASLDADDALGALERTVQDLRRGGMSRHDVWKVLRSVYDEDPAVIDPVITGLQSGDVLMAQTNRSVRA